MEVQPAGANHGSHLGIESLQEALHAPPSGHGDHLDYEEDGEDSVLFRHMTLDRQASALLAAQHDLSLGDEIAQVFEADLRLIHRDRLVPGHRIHQMACGHRSRDASTSPAGLDQVLKEEGQDIVRFDEAAVPIEDAVSIGIAVRSQPEMESA